MGSEDSGPSRPHSLILFHHDDTRPKTISRPSQTTHPNHLFCLLFCLSLCSCSTLDLIFHSTILERQKVLVHFQECLRSNNVLSKWTIPRTVSTLLPKFYICHIHFLVVSFLSAGSLLPQPNYRAIASGEGVKGVWVGAVPELMAGDLKIWAQTSQVDPINVPGYWIDKKGYDFKPGAKASPGEKVFYHLHGGAYILLSAHPNQPTTQIVHGLLDHSSVIERSVSFILWTTSV
jgi:hypothetical protein